MTTHPPAPSTPHRRAARRTRLAAALNTRPATAVILLLAGWILGYRIGRRHAADWRGRYAAAVHAATHDPLTRLPNRIGFQQLAAEVSAGWIGLLDVDGLKTINDRHGHHAGDTLLSTLATRLATATRIRGGSVARLGGDEFALLLPDGPPESARQTGEAILAALSAPLVLPTGHTLHPAASLGLAHLSAAGLRQAMTRADAAMYQAKHAGGHRVGLHEPGTDETTTPTDRPV